jgi:ABC-type glycerol-3-phosphate transport system substrate-binding protein
MRTSRWSGSRLTTDRGKITTGGEIGICTSCQDKAGAWKIVKEFMTMEEDYCEYGNYPILNDAFEEALDDEMYIFDSIEQEDGNWIFGRTDQEYYQDDAKVYPLTQEERDHLETYIRNCKTYMLLDQNVKNIVEEEAEVYFSGDRNVEDTAKMIQQRAELYLSEQQ